jgi:serine/threonine protein kinase
MLEAGTLIRERYKLKLRLGKNAGRQTWLARDLHTQERELVVVKLLAVGGDIEWGDLRLFEREGQILKQLNHPRIPRYRDYFALDERTLWFGLVQEYIPGASLKHLLDKGKRFTEAEIENIARQTLQILIYLHELNPPLLHRDIKPSNLILGEDNSIYLVDFGAVQDRVASEGISFTVVGTYGYTPLEQFGGRSVPASDIYALGATLIHLLTRTPPADLPSRDLNIQFRDCVTISHGLAVWLEKMTAPALERRFRTAQECLTASLNLEKVNLSKVNRQDCSLVTIGYGRKSLKPFNTEVSIERSPQFMEIVMPMRAKYLLDKWNWQNILTLIVMILAMIMPGIMFVKIMPSIAFALFICLTIVVPLGLFIVYLVAKHLFSTTQLFIDRHRFEITTEFLWSSIQQQGKTDKIQDVSVNYIAYGKHKQELRTNSIIISTKKSLFADRFERYCFGNGLSEAELIWLANEIRDWLQSSWGFPFDSRDGSLHFFHKH